jgi:general secretion pathway protein N
MKALSIASFRLNHLLLALAGILAALAVWPWLPSRGPDRTRPEAAVATAETVSPLAPLSQFAATIERPLFSPGRRPAPAAEPSGPVTASIEARYRLVGVVITGAARRAMITEGTRRIELGVGDRLEGWTVTHIEQNRLTLHSTSGDVLLGVKPAAGDAKPAK